MLAFLQILITTNSKKLNWISTISRPLRLREIIKQTYTHGNRPRLKQSLRSSLSRILTALAESRAIAKIPSTTLMTTILGFPTK
jgi:hypothetical protein